MWSGVLSQEPDDTGRWVVSFMLWQPLSSERTPWYTLGDEAGWASCLVWML